jgi:hypothetical protein
MADVRERIYKRRLESERGSSMSPEQIRAQKCATTRARNAERKRINIERQSQNRSPQDQLRELDSRLGKGRGAKRERARLAAKLADNN